MTDRKAADTSAGEDAGAASFIYLEQSLWQQFRKADSPEAFAAGWLALQSRYMAGTRASVLVLGEPDSGEFSPVASWPGEGAVSTDLASIAERCLQEGKPVLIEGELSHIALPVEVEGSVYGAVAISIEPSAGDARSLIWQLRWGSAWLKVLLLQQQGQEDTLHRQRMVLAFDLIAVCLEQSSFDASCHALVTELAWRMDCDPVSVGFIHKRRIKLQAVSHSAQFGERMSYIRDIESAMEEATDQDAVLLCPGPEHWEYRVTRVHGELLETHKAGAVLTLPMRAGGTVIGALTLERDHNREFSEDEVELLDSAVAVLGPLMYQQMLENRSILRKNQAALYGQAQRLFGPHYLGRKLAAASLLVLVLLFTVVTGEYRVTSPAVVEGMVQRTIVAPFDGYIEEQFARAGDVVEESQLLATLNQQDLALERIRWSTKSRQGQAEYDQALARQERSEANIIRAQIEQANAQVMLLDKQLERTRIRAPFSGLVMSGDLSQNVGAAVRKGQELFRVAPLENHRVILEVDEADVMDIDVGQQGVLLLSSMPDRALNYEVTLVTAIAQQSEGRNYFRVEAVLEEPDNGLRPGMEGVAKTNIEDRLVIRIWSEKMIDWLRIFTWTWWP